MKKGFTLLELLIVIIIISILASVGFVQYGNMVERGRSSEARYVCRSIMDAIEMHIAENSAVISLEDYMFVLSLNIPGVPFGSCDTGHYFKYFVRNVMKDGNGAVTSYTVSAVRCQTDSDNGKSPMVAGEHSYSIDFSVDRNSGSTGWSQGVWDGS